MSMPGEFFHENILNRYWTLESEIFHYFGYELSWNLYPITDETAFYWTLEPTIGGVCFGSSLPAEGWQDDPTAEWEYHWESLYRLSNEKWIYRAQDYTMLVCDTRTDGNKVLAIFDNAREVKEDKGVRDGLF